MTEIVEIPFLADGPSDAAWRLILAHGAGAPMDSDFMNAIAEDIAGRGIGVLRFEFPYMALRRTEGRRKPPDRAPILIEAWREAIRAAQAQYPSARLAIGGKSMGGRMATLLAAEPDCPDIVHAVVTLGYPFHPPGKPDRLRTDHFAALRLPVLMVQGTRDPFGTRDDVAGYTLPKAATVFWAEDGDHDLKPRKASGRSHAQALDEAGAEIQAFLERL